MVLDTRPAKRYIQFVGIYLSSGEAMVDDGGSIASGGNTCGGFERYRSRPFQYHSSALEPDQTISNAHLASATHPGTPLRKGP